MKHLFSKSIFLLVLVALAFFYTTSWLGTPPGNIWNSPDETANAFWAEKVSAREPLLVRDFAVGLGAGVVHPRSFDVYGTALVPGSFPGIFLLYGGLKVFTQLPFSVMTPLLTLFAGLALFTLLKRLFGEKTAFWSALFFFIHPAVLYYSGRGLFHNMLFIDLLIFAVALFALRPFKEGLGSAIWADDILAGMFFGFAMITRLSEAPWALLSVLVFLPFVGKERWKRAGAVILGGLLPLFILLSFNASSYGALLGSGYTTPEISAPLTAETVVADAVFPTASILPFGFHPRLIVLHGMDYGLQIFWWFSLAGILGLTVFLMEWKNHDKKKRTYFFVTAAISVWLLIFYGSWLIRDHYDPTRVTIGTSYVRYFLPIYILTLPWVAEGLLWIAERIKLHKSRVMMVFALLFTVLSFRVAITNGDESLLAVRETLRSNLEKRTLLLKSISEEGVIMTERHDKVFFPDRLRIISAMDASAFKTASSLRNYMPIYWYGVTPSEEQLGIMVKMALKENLVLEQKDSPFEGETLLQFKDVGAE